MNKILETIYPVLGAEPKDLNASAITGDYINVSRYGRVGVMIAFADGTATSGDIHMLLYQATTAAGGSAKVLNCLSTGRIYSQLAASYAAYAALTDGWTEETQATADEEWADDDSGEQCGIILLEVDAADLDVANGFNYIRCDVEATSSSKIAALIYLCGQPSYAAGPSLMKNPLV